MDAHDWRHDSFAVLAFACSVSQESSQGNRIAVRHPPGAAKSGLQAFSSGAPCLRQRQYHTEQTAQVAITPECCSKRKRRKIAGRKEEYRILEIDLPETTASL